MARLIRVPTLKVNAKNRKERIMVKTIVKALVQCRKPLAKLAGKIVTEGIKYGYEKYQQKKARELKEVR